MDEVNRRWDVKGEECASNSSEVLNLGVVTKSKEDNKHNVISKLSQCC